MSRCFPYTPRVCETKAEEREALLEPVELQSRREKKDKSHRKKEKKRERKHTDKDILSTYASCSGAKSDIFEVESNQSEKSDITVENELPTLSENICYRSDGTQSSPKRKRTIIRIKSLLKHSDPGTSGSSFVDPEAVQSTQFLKRAEIVHEEPKLLSAEADAHFEEATSTSYQHLSAAEIAYDSLIQNWAQPLLDSVLNDYGDEDWLFDTKLQNSHGSKRVKATNEVVFGCTNQTLWPQAQWLPEPGLWTLPLTVPF